MFQVLTCITEDHDPLLVGLAVAIWLVGGASLFTLLRRARESSPRRARQWHGLAAVTAGVAVWGTHFVAMLGYRASVPFSFRFELTALSVLVAVLVFFAAIRLHAGLRGPAGPVAGGALFAAGVTAMHFTGMAAIRAPALVLYDLSMILAGQGLAAAAAIAAFLVLDRVPGRRGLAVSSVLSLGAVAAMHFTAMAATTLIPDPTMGAVEMALSRDTLVIGTVVATVVLAFLALGSAVLDRYLTDMRGLSEAARDGILMLRHGQVIEVNNRFVALADRPREAIVGARFDDLLAPVGAGPIPPLPAGEGEFLLLRPGGDPLPVEVTRGRIEYRGRDCDILSVRDLTAIRESQRRIAHLAHHDPLTDLPNRLAMVAFLDDALARARASGGKVAILALDLDGFKSVNDLFGHHEGDRVLCAVAARLRALAGPEDLVCRIGGDEFLVVHCGDGDPAALARRIAGCFEPDLSGEKTLRHVGTSIGVAVFPDHARDAESLRQAADMALYRAKETGRGSIRIYDEELERRRRLRRELEQDLGQAIVRGELWLAYQPIFDAASRRVTGYEALLRWTHPRLGAIAPDQFIPIAEETGLILPIGEWVLREACREARRWPGAMGLAVNFSAMQFWSRNIVDCVEAALRDGGIAPGRLRIEVTQGVVRRDNAHLATTIDRLRALGVSLVMDDFGAGFSAIADLRRHVFDMIKIDRSFIADVENDPAKQAIVRAIVSLGRAMRLPVVAEGVETEAQFAMVAMAGCAEVQGFLLGAPDAAPSLDRDARARA